MSDKNDVKYQSYQAQIAIHVALPRQLTLISSPFFHPQK